MMRMRVVLLAILAAAVLCSQPGAWAGKGGNGGGKPGGGGEAGPPEIVVAKARKRGGFDLAVMDTGGNVLATIVANASSTWIAADWSPDGGRIAFYGDTQGPGIYVVDADGSGLSKITSTTHGYTTKVAWSPVAAPNGQDVILFDDDGGGGGMYGNSDVFSIQPDGTNRANITATDDRSERCPSWSPDAASIALVVAQHTSGMPTDVQVVDLAAANGVLYTAAETNVTDVAGSPLQNTSIHHVDWARNGDVLAVAAVPTSGTDADLWVLDLTQPTSVSNITNTPAKEERAPSWSPDDTEIAFWVSGGKTGVSKIDSSGQSAPTTLGNGARSPAWKR